MKAIFILFCFWDLSQHEKRMPPSSNWDGLLVWRNLKNGRQRNYVFVYNSASKMDRYVFLVSTLMYLRMRNRMMRLTNPYDSWLKIAVIETSKNHNVCHILTLGFKTSLGYMWFSLVLFNTWWPLWNTFRIVVSPNYIITRSIMWHLTSKWTYIEINTFIQS